MSILKKNGKILPPPLCCSTQKSKAEIVEFPDVATASDRYKTRFASPTGKWFLRRQAESLLRILEPWKGASILDIGGGHGQYTEDLIQQGYKVTVLGSSPAANAQIRHLVEAGRCKYLCGNLMAPPVAEKSYDIVISFRLLAHLQDWQQFVMQASHVADKAVIFDFPIVSSINVLYPILFWLKRITEGETTRQFSVFKEQDVLAEFEKAGFAPAARRPQYFLPMSFHRVLHLLPVSRWLEQVFDRLGLTQKYGSPVILCAERKTLA